jgi:hypothetical protein
MIYMLKHKEFGIYQGSFLGMGFWYPMSNMPEQGLCDFPTVEEAQQYKYFLCSKACEEPLKPEDLEILPFDAEMNKKLLAEGAK